MRSAKANAVRWEAAKPLAQREPPPFPASIPAPGFWGRFLYHAVPFRRRRIVANLERVFGAELERWQIRRLAQAAYGHFARSIFENLMFQRFRRAGPQLRGENREALERAIERGRGVLLLTGHVGNWELTPRLWLRAEAHLHGKVHVVRRRIRPRFLERYLVEQFRSAGIGVLEKEGSLSKIVTCLRRGELVAFILDQHAARRHSVIVDFFGSPASTFRSLAVAALRTGAPVVPLRFWREPDGTLALRFDEAIEPVPGRTFRDAVQANTQNYSRVIERMILDHPEQWIWMHRRWRDWVELRSPATVRASSVARASLRSPSAPDSA